MPRTVAAITASLLWAACVPSQGPSMLPFQDCLGCHQSGGSASRTWTAAGTWYRGTHVTLVDANGKSVTVRGNEVGNFYTAEGLAFPLHVWVDGKEMADAQGTPISLTYGGCNACHHAETITTGPLMDPGLDCMTCHGPGGMATAKFSAAGTALPAVYGAGATVEVGGNVTTANSVGNFYFYASTTPISFPATASVNGSAMGGGAPSGGCNGCHSGGVGSGNVGGGN